MEQEIRLNNEGFLKQIKEYEQSNKSIGYTLKGIEMGNVRLKSIDRYFQCLELLNNTLMDYYQLSVETTSAMKNALGWMISKDEEISKKIGYGCGESGTGSIGKI